MYPPHPIGPTRASSVHVAGRLVGGLRGAMVATSLGALLGGYLWAAGHLQGNAPPDGLRYEPRPKVGAVVETPYGPGEVTREIQYPDGPRWQIRLDSGRYVVLYRAQMVVRP